MDGEKKRRQQETQSDQDYLPHGNLPDRIARRDRENGTTDAADHADRQNDSGTSAKRHACAGP